MTYKAPWLSLTFQWTNKIWWRYWQMSDNINIEFNELDILSRGY